MEPVIPFDWYRMFLGDENPWYLAEILFRTVFLYLYMILMTRFVGRRRSLGKLTPFEYLLVIVLGPAAGGGMFYPNIPLLYAMAVMSTLAIMARLGAFLVHRSLWAQEFFEGKPLLVIQEGRILPEALERENLTEEDICRELRQAGLRKASQVKEAYFESSGQMSIFPYDKEKKVD